MFSLFCCCVIYYSRTIFIAFDNNNNKAYNMKQKYNIKLQY